MRSIPMTPDMVSLWVPSGQKRAQDLIRGNHGQCDGTHPNVPVIGECIGSNLLTDGGLNEWLSATNLEHWMETLAGTSTVNREAVEKIEGAYSCRLDIDAGNANAYIWQAFSMILLRKYKLIAWYKNSMAGKTAYIQIRDIANNVYLKEDGTWNVGAYSFPFPNSTIWKRYELDFYAHPDYLNYRISLLKQTAASSSIYFDKISVEEVGSSVINPSVGWYFDNTNDRIDIPEIVFTGEYTLFGWVLRSDVASLDPLFAHATETGKVAFKSDSNKLHVVAFNAGGNDETVNANLDRWDLIVVTRDANNKVDAYVNDGGATRLFANVAQVGTLKINRIGYDGTNYFNEYAAILGCANKAWSAAQVKNFYNATKGMLAPR